MDRLTRMALEAERRGLSYGKYAALVHEGILPPPRGLEAPLETQTVPAETDGLPKHWPKCKVCGKRFCNYEHPRMKLCSDKCREIRKKQLYLKYEEKRRRRNGW